MSPFIMGNDMQGQMLEVTQFSAMPHINEVEPLGEQDQTVLAAIKDVLVAHGAVDRFGVHLLHKHYDLQDDEVILENTDEQKRTQTTHVIARSDLGSYGKPIETQWRFSREHAAMACVAYCDYNSGHKHIHNQK